jgi:hypothetical protein
MFVKIISCTFFSCFFSVGAILTANAKDKGMFLGGRFLTGNLFFSRSTDFIYIYRTRPWFYMCKRSIEVLPCRNGSSTFTRGIFGVSEFFVSNTVFCLLHYPELSIFVQLLCWSNDCYGYDDIYRKISKRLVLAPAFVCPGMSLRRRTEVK